MSTFNLTMLKHCLYDSCSTSESLLSEEFAKTVFIGYTSRYVFSLAVESNFNYVSSKPYKGIISCTLAFYFLCIKKGFLYQDNGIGQFRIE